MDAERRILAVEDEPDLLELVYYNLSKEGFKVTKSNDGADALEKLKKEAFDLVLLDLMLPGVSGVEICRKLRASPRTASLPVIMLTAKTDEIDRVLGLEMGADDYITKPFSPRELVARVRAVLRRAEGAQLKELSRLGDLSIDGESYKVYKSGEEVVLSATEFKLLQFMCERTGRVLTRDILLDAVWGSNSYVEPRTVDVHIRRLRAALEDDPSNPQYIKTRRGIGYYVEAQS